jgi:hypothetical protein
MINRKYNLIFLLLCFIVTKSIAQDNKPNVGQTTHASASRAWQFHSINQIGFLEGQAGSAFQIQTINGFQYKSWFAGIGAGLDYYRFRGIPLFIDFRKEFGSARNYFFIYGGVGVHFIWLTDDQKADFNMSHYGNNDFSNGLYFDAGIGYKVVLNNRTAIFISPGFSHKSTEVKNTITICPFQGPCYITPNRFDFNMNRLSVNVGVEF